MVVPSVRASFNREAHDGDNCDIEDQEPYSRTHSEVIMDNTTFADGIRAKLPLTVVNTPSDEV